MYSMLKGVKGYLIIQEVCVDRFQVTCISFIDLFYFISCQVVNIVFGVRKKKQKKSYIPHK